jgi:methionyl-tRNA formyltransferase
MKDDFIAMNKPGIVFMGTPEFAVATLEAIVNAGYNVKGVITSPDKPSGRGLRMHASPVKEFALHHNLTVLQPLKLKDPVFLRNLYSLQADLQVIVAFRMLPEEVWSMPRLGTFNLHASLLPQYRGAAPINWAIINGETKTGVTTFFLNHEIDKGSVIFTKETVIGESETAGDVHDRLMVIGAQLVLRTIESIAKGIAMTVEQHLLNLTEPLKPAPKIFKNDCRIQWNNEIQKLHNHIRGLSPYPTAWSEIVTGKGENLTVKIYSVTPIRKQHLLDTGVIETDGKSFLWIAALDGFISIDIIQLQGKKQMPVAEFLHGFPQAADCRFK